AAGVGLWLMDWPAVIWSAEGPRGNILNVYTRPESRRQGIARLLVGAATGWCRENGVRAVILHASAEGRELYQSLGFKPTNEMRIVFE
ncbi:MAG: GNAT family N-acetyltransferase, partial [Bryobacteraceae bacterium]